MEEVNFNETTKTETVESEKALKCDSNEQKKSKTPTIFKVGIALLCATSALSLGAIGACGFLGYKLYKNQKIQNTEPQDSMESVVASRQPTISEDGYWIINGVKTQFKAEVVDGQDGQDGQDGVSVVDASIMPLDKWGITTQIIFKMSDNTSIELAPQTQISSEHFYEAEDMTDIITLAECYNISKIKLAKNIYLSSSIKFASDTIIDLNKKTLDYVAINPLKVEENSTLTFKNGSVNFQTNVGVSVQGENAELSFEKVTVSATSTVAETLENNASINLTNTTIQTVQQGRYGASRTSSVGSLFVIKGENANITVTGSKFETNKSIVSASENATEFKIVVKETKINTTAPILDINTDEVVPTLNIDNSTMQNSTVTELNTSPITSGSFNVDPTELGATLVGESFNVNGLSIIAENLADLVEKVEAGSTINLTSDVQLKTALVIDKKLTINLADCTISIPNDTIGNGVFHVVEGGNLTINGNGTINAVSKSYWHMAVWVDGGKATINGGTYTNVGGTNPDDPNDKDFDLMYVKGGELVINGGTFIAESPKWTLNIKDAYNKVSNVVINGGTFVGYNPAESHTENPVVNFVANGYIVVERDGVYTVESKTLIELAADTTIDSITLAGDVTLLDVVFVNHTLTLNLNGFNISRDNVKKQAIAVLQNGDLTINGEGTIDGACENAAGNIAVYAYGGKLTINGGTYTNVGATSNTTPTHIDMIYTSLGGQIIINGGTFIAETPQWTLNMLDNSNSSIVVNGGTFVGYNPAESHTENPVVNFVANGYTVVERDGSYIVVAE